MVYYKLFDCLWILNSFYFTYLHFVENVILGNVWAQNFKKRVILALWVLIKRSAYEKGKFIILKCQQNPVVMYAFLDESLILSSNFQNLEQKPMYFLLHYSK